MSQCPICSDGCDPTPSQEFSGDCFNRCRYARLLHLDDYITGNPVCAERVYNAIFSDLLAHRDSNKDRRYYWDDRDDTASKVINGVLSVNAAVLMKGYPEWALDRYDFVLMNLYRLFNGDPIPEEVHYVDILGLRRACLVERMGEEPSSVMRSMVGIGYLAESVDGTFVFTQKAWDRLNELIQHNEGSRMAFIALGYDGTADIRRAIKDAISEAGYVPVVMDETQHNNQIVPEMFDYIKRCRFLVMDMTYPNHGAYYEAGLARGMGKQTILTCKADAMHSRDKKTRPHFDVAQQSTVVWADLDELRSKLADRIRMTID